MDSKEIARKRIISLIEEQGITYPKFEKLFGLRNHTVAEWKQGTLNTYMRILPQIAEYFNVSVEWILGEDKLRERLDKAEKELLYSMETRLNNTRVPIIGSIQAGYPVESFDSPNGYVNLPYGISSNNNLFALRVVGDSMMPLVMDKDIIICNKNINNCNGKICAVTIDNESTLKRIRIDKEGVTLIPTNPMYKELHYSAKKAEEKGFHVDGVLVQMIRNF